MHTFDLSRNANGKHNETHPLPSPGLFRVHRDSRLRNFRNHFSLTILPMKTYTYRKDKWAPFGAFSLWESQYISIRATELLDAPSGYTLFTITKDNGI